MDPGVHKCAIPGQPYYQHLAGCEAMETSSPCVAHTDAVVLPAPQGNTASQQPVELLLKYLRPENNFTQ